MKESVGAVRGCLLGGALHLLCLIPLFSSLLRAAEPALGDPHQSSDLGEQCNAGDDLAALDMLSAQIKRNYERIETWSGSCEIDFAVYFSESLRLPEAPTAKEAGMPEMWPTLLKRATLDGDPGYWRVTQADASFVVDNSRGLYYASQKLGDIEWLWDLTTGKQYAVEFPHPTEEAILSSDGGMAFSRGMMHGAVAGHPESEQLPRSQLVRIVGSENAKRDLSFFDARESFASLSSRSTQMTRWFSRDLDSCADAFRRGGDSAERARQAIKLFRRDGDEVVYTLVLGKEGASQIQTTYSSEVGFNVVRYTKQRGGSIEIDRRVSYAERAGIFLPASVEAFLQRPASRDASQTVYVMAWKLNTTDLNNDVPKEAFDVSRFALKYGDKIHNEVTSQLWIIDEGGRQTLSTDFKFRPTKLENARAGRGDKYLLLIINGAVLLVLGSYFVWRRRSQDVSANTASGSGK